MEGAGYPVEKSVLGQQGSGDLVPKQSQVFHFLGQVKMLPRPHFQDLWFLTLESTHHNIQVEKNDCQTDKVSAAELALFQTGAISSSLFLPACKRAIVEDECVCASSVCCFVACEWQLFQTTPFSDQLLFLPLCVLVEKYPNWQMI